MSNWPRFRELRCLRRRTDDAKDVEVAGRTAVAEVRGRERAFGDGSCG